MDKITEIESLNTAGETVIHILIDKGNGEFASMLKSEWESQQEAAELGGTL